MVTSFFAICLVHRVADLAAATRFLGAALEMKLKSSDEHGVLLENGAVGVRLVAADADDELHLELTTLELEASLAELLAFDGVQVSRDRSWVSKRREVVALEAPHGIRLSLTRDYNEDELGVTPDLPTTAIWEPRAEKTVQAILKHVPLPFRDLARNRMTARGEQLAASLEQPVVPLETAIRAIIQCTPAFDLDHLRHGLRLMGFDPERWEADFER
ncbi:MAG: DUF2621 family protein [Myxococcales bacterium]|nr:DUF2621 family protein [Myxococcales bacterium]